MKLEKNTHSFRTHAAKWSKLESEVKKWIKDTETNSISVSTKMITCEARRWAVAHNINDFASCYCFMKRNRLRIHGSYEDFRGFYDQ
jgi:t-SNARE complex subunit (syntaxin)